MLACSTEHCISQPVTLSYLHIKEFQPQKSYFSLLKGKSNYDHHQRWRENQMYMNIDMVCHHSV